MRRERYSLGLLCCSVLGAAGLLPAASAQMHHVDAPDRVTRAVGVYEWTGDLSKPTASRFVPVSLFIDGHFEDAGLYLARPVPMALEPGDVYALEHAGEPQGLLDLDLAKRVVTGTAMQDDNPEGAWYGYGRFKVESAPPPPKLNRSAHLSTIQGTGASKNGGDAGSSGSSDSGEPHMGRRGSDNGSETGSGKNGQTSAPTSSGGSPSAGSEDDQDRPTLRRRDPAQDATRRRDYGKTSKQASVTAAGPALGEDPDRPILGRSTDVDTGPAELTGLPVDMHQAVAVSDARHNDTHPFAREWDSPQEKADTLAALEQLAKPKVAAYLSANDLVPSALPLQEVAGGQAAGVQTAAATATTLPAPDANAAPPKLQRGVPQQYQHSAPATPDGPATPTPYTAPAQHATVRKTKPTLQPPAALAFASPEVSGYTLTYGGLPTFVFTAAASAQPTKATASPEPGQHRVVYVTVVAQRLPSGGLQTNLATVTDSAHLDRTPRLRLIDAVDPDDSHRASLLFELRGASSRQFALYRLTAVQAEQTFATASIE